MIPVTKERAFIYRRPSNQLDGYNVHLHGAHSWAIPAKLPQEPVEH